MPIRDYLEQNPIVQGMGTIGGIIRYGMPAYAKEAMALRGDIPGFDPQNLRTQLGNDIEQRRAAAYLFAQAHPYLSAITQPIVDLLRSGDDPAVLGVTRDAQKTGARNALTIRQLLGMAR